MQKRSSILGNYYGNCSQMALNFIEFLCLMHWSKTDCISACNNDTTLKYWHLLRVHIPIRILQVFYVIGQVFSCMAFVSIFAVFAFR